MSEHDNPPVISGRYHVQPGMDPHAPEGPAGAPLMVVVRVDVDGPQALDHISVEVRQRFPASVSHGVARVIADPGQ